MGWFARFQSGLAALGAALLGVTLPLSGFGAYPERPIRFIVPQAAGSPIAISSRSRRSPTAICSSRCILGFR